MWTIVYYAKNKKLAEKLRERLRESGVISKLRPAKGASGGENDKFDVLVPAAEVEEAHDVIIEMNV